jgi:hypothetical protein
LTSGASKEAWITRSVASTTTGGGGGAGGGGTTTGSLLLLQALSVAKTAAATESETIFFIVLTLQLIVAQKFTPPFTGEIKLQSCKKLLFLLQKID